MKLKTSVEELNHRISRHQCLAPMAALLECAADACADGGDGPLETKISRMKFRERAPELVAMLIEKVVEQHEIIMALAKAPNDKS